MISPETKYAKSGDISIAYQAVGEGPPDILVIPGFVSHLELNWDSHFFGGVFERLARMGRLIALDKRGVGLSDRTLGFGSLDERMDDVRAVLDAAGAERVSIVAVSEGGPLALLFAATHPERVEKLVLYASFARLLVDDDYPIGVPTKVFESLLQYVERNWGSGAPLRLFVQHAPDEDATKQFLARFERYTASPAGAVAVLRDYVTIDVRPVLGSVRAPTLVLHTTGDPMIPVALGRYLHEHIDGARMIEIDDAFHIAWDERADSLVLDPLEEFVLGRVRHAIDVADRVLTTVLFTDIVDSTATAARLGDAPWRALLDRHDAAVRQELDAFRGREVNTTGDGFLATFDGPARAVRCAQAIAQRAAALGIGVRAGVHTGECEIRGDDLAGIAVHVGARVMACADEGSVLVTRTVRDLVVGSGIAFDSRGTHALKGVAEPMELFAALG